MAKKLNDPSKGNKNLGTKQRGIGVLINSEPEIQQKEKVSSKEFDTEDVKNYSLRINIPCLIGLSMKWKRSPQRQSEI